MDVNLKTIVYPMTIDLSFYLINTQGDVAKITVTSLKGTIPTHDEIIAKLNETISTMQGTGEGLAGTFRACDYDEYCNAKLNEINPVAAAGGPYTFPMQSADNVWFADAVGCGCATCEPKPPADDQTALFAKLEGDSLDAIVEVMGEGAEFRVYNKGKSAMRDWFLGRLSRHFGIAWKLEEEVSEAKQKDPKDAPDYQPEPTGFEGRRIGED